MEDIYAPFKVAQKWETQLGQRFLIKEIRHGETYPIVCISLDTGKKHFFDEDGYEVAGYPSDNDLFEQIL